MSGLFLAVGLSVGIWLAGFLTMRFHLGDPLMRLSYDCMHLFFSHRPDPRVLIIAINEDTERKLGLHQGESFSRRFHARLLTRLKEAGAERVCYDILFDRPSPDAGADEELVKAVRSHGHVILGATEEAIRHDNEIRQNKVIPPFSGLREAAEGWGLLNVSLPDADGVIRRFDASTELVPAMTTIAAGAELGHPPSRPEADLWMCYQAWPGEIPTLEFADCMDPATVPDGNLHGKTVFIGGEYAADSYGRRDSFRTPYSRFGMPDISGVAWHATAFLNARENFWLVSAGQIRNGIWCIPFALASLLIFRRKNGAWVYAGSVVIAWFVLTMAVAVTSILMIWSNLVLVNWLVPVLVQFPCCLVGLLSHRLSDSKQTIVMAPDPKGIGEVDVFISFSSKDESLAVTLKNFLDRNGCPAWVCKEHIQEGTSWAKAIIAAIEKCEAALFILSKDSLVSPWCESEIARAKSLGKRLLYLRTDDTPLKDEFSLLLQSRQEIDGRGKEPEILFPRVFTALDQALHPHRTDSRIVAEAPR